MEVIELLKINTRFNAESNLVAGIMGAKSIAIFESIKTIKCAHKLVYSYPIRLKDSVAIPNFTPAPNIKNK